MPDQIHNHSDQARNGTRREPEPGPRAHDPTGGAAPGAGEHRCLELCPICRSAELVRASSSPELREQWQTIQREALLTARALIEHYLAGLDDRPAHDPRPRVEDIAID